MTIEVERMVMSAGMIQHLWWALGGAVSFWFPIISVFAVQRADTNVLIANLVSMLGLSLCCAIRRWVYPQGRQGIWMLVGLYCLGPIFLSTATTFANGGFVQIHGWTGTRSLLLACVFPPLQFLLAATSGLWPSLVNRHCGSRGSVWGGAGAGLNGWLEGFSSIFQALFITA